MSLTRFVRLLNLKPKQTVAHEYNVLSPRMHVPQVQNSHRGASLKNTPQAFAGLWYVQYASRALCTKGG